LFRIEHSFCHQLCCFCSWLDKTEDPGDASDKSNCICTNSFRKLKLQGASWWPYTLGLRGILPVPWTATCTEPCSTVVSGLLSYVPLKVGCACDLKFSRFTNRGWRFFMIKLWNHSLLDARTMNTCNTILQGFQDKK
jgi:hypothetical protein